MTPTQLKCFQGETLVYKSTLCLVRLQMLSGLIFHLNVITIVISTKQLDSAKMDVSSLDNEVFPMEEDLVNFTQQLSPAQISIPAQVLLEETSRSGRDGKL